MFMFPTYKKKKISSKGSKFRLMRLLLHTIQPYIPGVEVFKARGMFRI